MRDFSTYLSGKELYGDDFNADEIRAWFDDEREGYANLGAGALDETQYEYNALNVFHGFDRLPRDRRFNHVLGFGSCFGGEFAPIAPRIDKLTIVDPSDAFVRSKVFGVPCNYVKPVESGTLPFEDESFDLLTCFGVLHHVPNVSHVVSELARCLKPGGYALIREPIVSMGDWRVPRPGLTKRERGLPIDFFRSVVERNGLKVQRLGWCVFPPLPQVGDKIKKRVFNYRWVTLLDAGLCAVMVPNLRYHATSTLHKFRPNSAYFVLQK
jgi:SAM-dependent methyltransferase